MKRSGPIARRTPIKRTALKPWRRKPEDKLDPAEREHVLNRDPLCIIERLIVERRIRVEDTDPCANLDGGPPTYRSYEHVKDQPGMGIRATSKTGLARRHGVGACLHHNVNGGTSKHRGAINEWLAHLEATGGL